MIQNRFTVFDYVIKFSLVKLRPLNLQNVPPNSVTLFEPLVHGVVFPKDKTLQKVSIHRFSLKKLD